MNRTYSDILILLKAGYTKDEIDNMADTAPVSPPFQEQAADPAALAVSPSSPSESLPEESVPAPPVDDRPPQPAADPKPEPDVNQQILQTLADLVKAVQAGNRGSAEIPGKIVEPGAAALDTLRSLGGIVPPADN